MDRPLDFFLGSVSSRGFCSLFPTLSAQPELYLYLIKAGPGCGKSTLMRQLAQKAPGPVEHIHCSSDPDSLDGVILWQQKAALLDATAPHTLEPACPGARERVVSLYHILDHPALRRQLEPITRQFARCHELHRQASQHIAAAGQLLAERRRACVPWVDANRAVRYAQRLGARLLPMADPPGQMQTRLLSAVTPQGIVVFRDTVRTLADRIIVLHDDLGAVSPLIQQQLLNRAQRCGQPVICCPCSLDPQGPPEHLLFPQLRLAVLTGNEFHPFAFPGQQNVRCARFVDVAPLQQWRNKLHFQQQTALALLHQAMDLQRQAKTAHDKLEQFYQRAADFSAIAPIRAALEAELQI